MSYLREFVVVIRANSKVTEAALRGLEFRTLVNLYPSAVHIVSDTLVDIAKMEAEVLARPSESEDLSQFTTLLEKY